MNGINKEQNLKTEKEKIEEIMTDYSAFFQDGTRAVSFSTNGDFFYYATTAGRYDTFVKFNTSEELRSIIKTTVIDALAENVIAGADDLYYSMDEIRVKKYDAQDFDYKTELLRLRESLNVIQRQTTIVAEAFGKFSEKETGSPLL